MESNLYVLGPIMKYETLVLIFIRARKEKNFSLYMEVLEKLAHLFFALDYVNYSQWMTLHIHDMKSLPDSSNMGLRTKVTGSY